MQTRTLFALSLLVLGVVERAATAQQVPIPTKLSDVTPPATGIVMHPEYAKAVGRFAYIWGWPMVNQMNPPSRHHAGA